MSGNNQYTAKQFIDAIPGSGGIIKTIAHRVGCDWNTAKKYINMMPTIKQAYDDECETLIDSAESVVINSFVKKKNVSDAKWYLIYKGKDRGYTTRQELTGADGGPMRVKVIDYGLDDDNDTD